MVDTNKLRGKMAEKGYSQQFVAQKIGVSPKTFYSRMKKGVFGSDEICALVDLLDINDPADIFFAKKVT